MTEVREFLGSWLFVVVGIVTMILVERIYRPAPLKRPEEISTPEEPIS